MNSSEKHSYQTLLISRASTGVVKASFKFGLWFSVVSVVPAIVNV